MEAIPLTDQYTNPSSSYMWQDPNSYHPSLLEITTSPDYTEDPTKAGDGFTFLRFNAVKTFALGDIHFALSWGNVVQVAQTLTLMIPRSPNFGMNPVDGIQSVQRIDYYYKKTKQDWAIFYHPGSSPLALFFVSTHDTNLEAASAFGDLLNQFRSGNFHLELPEDDGPVFGEWEGGPLLVVEQLGEASLPHLCQN